MTTRLSEDRTREALALMGISTAARIDVETEMARARSEEARLLEEVRAKDERIKELMTQIRQCASGNCGHSGEGEQCLQDLTKVSP